MKKEVAVNAQEPATGKTREAADAAVAADAGAAQGGALDERAVAMLAFERQWWRRAGSKEQAIRDQFGLSAIRYYQILNALLEDPAALAHDPILVRRLRRLRASRIRRAT